MAKKKSRAKTAQLAVSCAVSGRKLVEYFVNVRLQGHDAENNGKDHTRDGEAPDPQEGISDALAFCFGFISH